VLWRGGISFGGVIAFIFADLIIIPIVNIYRRYYGRRAAVYLFVVSYLTMATSGLIVGLVFNATGLTPTNRAVTVFESGISWDYNTFLNIAFLVLIAVLLYSGHLRMSDIVAAQDRVWNVVPQFPAFVVYMVAGLAETNRPPFDLVEAESELVAGFMVEYGSTPYLLFMLGEYVAITTMCAMATILFLGGWLPPIALPPFTWVPGVIWFALKVFFMFFMFAMAKAIVPRYRYDQLMRLGWKVFLPLSLAMVVIVAGVLQFAGLAPK